MQQCPLQTDKCHNKGEVLPIDDLSSAAARGNLQLVRTLLERGINVNEKNTFGRTPLQVTRLSCPLVAEVLLQHGADPNQCDHYARCSGDLISCVGSDIVGTNFTLLHDASREGFKDMVRCLLKYGADVNIRDSHGNTPAHTAAKYGHYSIVRYLSQAMDLIHSYNNNGHTPLDSNFCGIAVPRKQRKWVMKLESKPKSLKNLCCICIRDTLGTNNLKQYHALPLPKRLKDYIALQNN